MHLAIRLLATLLPIAYGLLGVAYALIFFRDDPLARRLAPRALFGNIFLRGLRLAAIGVGLGAAATYGLIRVLRSQVFGLDAASPAAFASARWNWNCSTAARK